jgi:hypothetical protein
LELPGPTGPAFLLKSCWKEEEQKAPRRLTVGRTHTFTLKPFEVLVLEAIPERS